MPAKGRGAQPAGGLSKDADVAGPHLTWWSPTAAKGLIVSRGSGGRRMVGGCTSMLSAALVSPTGKWGD